MYSLSPDLSFLSPMDVNHLSDENTAIEINNLCLNYGKTSALSNIEMRIPKGQVTAFIGPSGCGKSTLLRCINRMNDLVDNCKIKGSIKSP